MILTMIYKLFIKKLNFLNIAYIDLLKRNFKNGLYRLSWYL